jgi:hypothetical protein
MTQVYRAEPFDRVDRTDGCYVYIQEGQSVVIDGKPMVKLGGGAYWPADGWYSTREEAMAAIACRIEDWGHKLLAQAERLRRGGEGA